MVHKPFNFVLDNKDMLRTDPAPIMVKMLEDGPTTDAEVKLLREVASVAYGAASDTTASALMTFFLAMALHPTIQNRAQAEIDAVLSASSSLPTFDQKGSLPYIEAVLREVLRWRPVVPLCVPHATTADDTYDGYFIPRGKPPM
uniref:Cytochrome P450 n=1 Tax=Mycena chlorophos TaxID=658473 RepID=A0ABQ0M4V6_MYCCL|nr:cytochrome P450 [Mycena chlorophos]